jgi:acid stress chaperone HdeB
MEIREWQARSEATSLKPLALAGLLERRSEQGTAMRPWLIMFGVGLASIGLQAVQAQVTIDITKITCSEFLADQLTDSRTLAIWLNGYVNGARGKTLIDPLSAGHNALVRYCESHMDGLVLDGARNVFGADK